MDTKEEYIRKRMKYYGAIVTEEKGIAYIPDFINIPNISNWKKAVDNIDFSDLNGSKVYVKSHEGENGRVIEISEFVLRDSRKCMI